MEAFHEDAAVLNDGTLVAVLEVVPLGHGARWQGTGWGRAGSALTGCQGSSLPVVIYLGRRPRGRAYETSVSQQERLRRLVERMHL